MLFKTAIWFILDSQYKKLGNYFLSVFNFIKKKLQVKIEYEGLKKYLTFRLVFLKIKIPKNNYKTVRNYIKDYRPKLSDNITQIISNSGANNYSELAVCAIFKNEPDIVEWINYHKIIGVQKFYLYDNESDADMCEILKPFIDSGLVVYHKIVGSVQQIPAYLDAVCRYRDKVKWIAFIDLDEYIVPIEKYSLTDFLKDYEKEVGVGINWVMFDSNGYKNRPDKLVIEAYLRRGTVAHSLIKSISKAAEISYISNPHFCFYKNSKLAVNENFEKIGSQKTFFEVKNAFVNPPSTVKIQVNHYQTKSEEDYLKKCATGFADQLTKRDFIQELLNFKEYTYDDKILKYVSALKRKD